MVIWFIKKKKPLITQHNKFFLVEPFTNEQYKKIRKEMDALKDDNERLRRRKDELEMLFEHSNVKEAFNIQKYKVKNNSFWRCSNN